MGSFSVAVTLYGIVVNCERFIWLVLFSLELLKMRLSESLPFSYVLQRTKKIPKVWRSAPVLLYTNSIDSMVTPAGLVARAIPFAMWISFPRVLLFLPLATATSLFAAYHSFQFSFSI